MTKYKNLSKNSGVKAFEIGTDYIKVQFINSLIYLYNYSKPGRSYVEEMKKLAEKGIGLNTYISKYIKKNYAKKSI